MDLGLGFGMSFKFKLFSSFLVFILTNSCMEKPSDDTYAGMSVNNNLYQNAIREAWGSEYILDNPEILFMQKGAASLILKDVAIAGSTGAPQLLRAEKLEIIDIQDSVAPTPPGENPDPSIRQIKFIISQEIQEFSQNSENKPLASVRELPIRYQNAANFIAQDFKLFNQQKKSKPIKAYEGEIDGAEYGFERVASFLYACDPTINKNIECQNFSYKDTIEDPPELVKANENCRGLENCKIKKRNFVLNMILNYTDNETGAKQKLKAYYEFSISRDVPYLARLTDFCMSQILTTPQGKIPARFCNRVKDFKFN